MSTHLPVADEGEGRALPASQDRVTDAPHGAPDGSPPSGSVPTSADFLADVAVRLQHALRARQMARDLVALHADYRGAVRAVHDVETANAQFFDWLEKQPSHVLTHIEALIADSPVVARGHE